MRRPKIARRTVHSVPKQASPACRWFIVDSAMRAVKTVQKA